MHSTYDIFQISANEQKKKKNCQRNANFNMTWRFYFHFFCILFRTDAAFNVFFFCLLMHLLMHLLMAIVNGISIGSVLQLLIFIVAFAYNSIMSTCQPGPACVEKTKKKKKMVYTRNDVNMPIVATRALYSHFWNTNFYCHLNEPGKVEK